jgi:hypothetical protein
VAGKAESIECDLFYYLNQYTPHFDNAQLMVPKTTVLYISMSLSSKWDVIMNDF